jgi:hypothetical protein
MDERCVAYCTSPAHYVPIVKYWSIQHVIAEVVSTRTSIGHTQMYLGACSACTYDVM